MSDSQPTTVKFLTISADEAGQRVDNFLINQLKGAPKGLIYRIVRKGEVRINKKRVKPEYKLQESDIVRIPPVRIEASNPLPSAGLKKVQAISSCILYEDDHFIVLNKPSGMAVHGGSGVSFGVIEAMRALRPEARFLELVHRLDRDTSGCLLIAKKRSCLRKLHELLRDKKMQKFYHTFVKGYWPKRRTQVKAALLKQHLASGERMVRIHQDGKPSETRFKILQHYDQGTLLEAFPVTGRTHQIRVHCQGSGHPIAGDPKYGDREFSQQMHEHGLGRLFLHAARLQFPHPATGKPFQIEAPLGGELNQFVGSLTHS